MQLALNGRQSAAAAKSRIVQTIDAEREQKGAAALPTPGAPSAIDDALKRANERINQAIAEGLLSDPATPGQPEAQSPGLTPSAERAPPPARPLLQELIKRHDDLGKVLDAFAAADPVHFQPERFVALLEEALSDVERALTPTDPPDCAPTPASEVLPPSMIELVAKPDLDPAELFSASASLMRRPGELRFAPPPVTHMTATVESDVRGGHGRWMIMVLMIIGLVPVLADPVGRDRPIPAGAPADAAQAAAEPVAPVPQQAAAIVPAGSPKAEPEPGGADAALATLYATRGDDMLAKKDISAARKFYEFAAGAGNARAAMALARTYDPVFFAQYGVVGLRADPGLASIWYRRAALLGGPASLAQAEDANPKPDQHPKPDTGAAAQTP